MGGKWNKGLRLYRFGWVGHCVEDDGGAAEAVAWRTFIPCYKVATDSTTLRSLIIVRWNADKTVQDPVKLADADRRFPAVPVPQTGSLDAV